ncbi:MAG: putative zinc-binding protein [Verrucomicrobiota bacterium]
MNDSPNQPPPKPSVQQLPCVLACSGCSHAGELADLTARRLQKIGVARMSCLAGVGGRVKSITTTVQRAPELLMIDGWPLECGANTLRLAGITEFRHLKLHELGVRKHETEITSETVQSLAESAVAFLNEANAVSP